MQLEGKIHPGKRYSLQTKYVERNKIPFRDGKTQSRIRLLMPACPISSLPLSPKILHAKNKQKKQDLLRLYKMTEQRAVAQKNSSMAHESYLSLCREERRGVLVILRNESVLHGYIKGFDAISILLEDSEREWFIFKNSIMSITLDLQATGTSQYERAKLAYWSRYRSRLDSGRLSVNS